MNFLENLKKNWAKLNRKRKGILFLCVLSLFLIISWGAVKQGEIRSFHPISTSGLKRKGNLHIIQRQREDLRKAQARQRAKLLLGSIAVIGYGGIAWYLTGKDGEKE